MRTVRTAAQIRELLQHACSLRLECDDCYLGVIRTDPDADGCNWNIKTTSFSDDRDACDMCVRAVTAECQKLRASVILPPTDLPVREIESLQTILAVRELGVVPRFAAGEPKQAVQMGYAFIAADGKLDVSSAGRKMLRRL